LNAAGIYKQAGITEEQQTVILHGSALTQYTAACINYASHCCKFPAMVQTSNMSKAHVTRDSSGPATLAINVGLKQ